MLEWLHRTKRFKFPNGLTLLTYNLPNSEAAAVHFSVQAGYFCESDAEVGLAHLLEHMYFKGSANFPEPGSLGIRLKGLGGQVNATTSYDQTTYFCEVPADNLEPALALMSDPFLAPLYPEEELRKECEVVIEEFNRKLDSPASYSQEKLIQLAFQVHRMKRWRIGTPQQLRSYTRENLFDYFHRYYQPQNMVVTITGKLDEDWVQEKVAESFSKMQNQKLIKDFGPAEPPQTRLRYAMHKGEATQSFLHMAFHVPGVLDPQQPGLEFLVSLLAGGRSSRLHRYVVEQQRSASAVSAGFMAFEDVGMILISAVTEAGQIRQAATDIWAVIEDLKRNGISSTETLKIKNRLKLYQEMQTEDVLDLASLLSYHEAYGGYETIEDYLNAMQSLTENQIVEVTSRHIDLPNATILEFVNEDLPGLSAEEYEELLKSKYIAPEIALPAPLVTSSGTPGRPEDPAQPIVQKGKVTYIFLPDPHLPFVSGGIFFLGGRNEENESTAGITQLLLRSALKGTPELNAEQLAFRFDSLGNPPRLQTSRDMGGFLFETLPELFLDMWSLLFHALLESNYPDQEVETEKLKLNAAIRRNYDDNFVRPLQLFQKAYYGTHPYGLPDPGFEQSISGFSPEDLLGWKNRIFTADRTIIAVAGNFHPQTIFPQLEKFVEPMPQNGLRFQAPTQVNTPQKREEIETRPKKQTAFVLGFPATPASSPDIYQYEAIQQILSGMGGRLFLNLRSKQALAYTVYAGASSHLYSGTFLTYIAGDASKERQALDGMWHELEELKKVPVSEQELQNARNALIGSYTLNTQNASSRIVEALNSHLLQRPIPFIPIYREILKSIHPEQLLHTAQKTFRNEMATIGMIRGSTAGTQAEKEVLSEDGS